MQKKQLIKPTPEQLEEQARRAFVQKRNALAEGILFNAIHAGEGIRAVINDGKHGVDFKPVVEAAIEAADHMMAKLYSVSIRAEE
ncbi:MAG: hypothetical protein J6T17_02140 [Clostridia bacterium]|nr:hypothetical protein [Clostridia bacterium]